MFPSLKEMEKWKMSGDYRRIPLCLEIYSDRYTPVEAMRIFMARSDHAFLLESASQNGNWGRFSFLGYEPEMEVTCKDGMLRIRQEGKNGEWETTHRQVEDPGAVLREILRDYKSPDLPGLPPFTGGLVGYFSFEYLAYQEKKLAFPAAEERGFQDLDLMLFDRVVAFDHYRQKITLICGVQTDNLEESYAAAEAKLQEMAGVLRDGERKEMEPLHLQSPLVQEFSKERYCQMVQRAKEYIREGDIFQVVLSNPSRADASGSLFDTYRALRASNPSPYMFYFSGGSLEMAGASPETLVKVRDGEVETFPLAGTRPRGKTLEEDLELEKDLLQDEKELAEHNMLVDLGRNDIGRISKVGSVKVLEYLAVQRYAFVMHLGSTVTGELKPEKDAVDALGSILPAGTLSGAPKFRAIQIIQELEGIRRGVYGGAVGYLDFSGNLDVCIAIRLVYKMNGEVCVQTGAGIVADSVPEKEYEECANKAKAVVEALKAAEGGLE